MSPRDRMTLVAGVAIALATSALTPLFADRDWGSETLGAILVVVAAGLIGRRLSLPAAVQPLWAVVALVGYLAVVFGSATLKAGILPTGKTLDLLNHLLTAANADVQRYRAPVPSTAGLVLVTAAGVGLAAVLVDLLAVTWRRAGLAGLPLLAVFAVPAAVVPGGVGGVPFVLGGVGWLLMLHMEGREVIERWGTAPGSASGESSVGRMGRRIGVSALGVAVAVPLLVPGLNTTLLGGRSGTGEGGGASSSAHTYNPITRLRSQLTLPNPVQLLQYRTDDPKPDYLRLTTLDRYDGGGWSASTLSARRDQSQVQKGIRPGVGDGGPHQRFQMKVFVDGSHLDVFWLPLPFGPTRVEVSGTWLWDGSSQTAFSASRTTKNLPVYDVRANRVDPDREALGRAVLGAVDPGVRAKYGTPVTVSRYVKKLTARVVAGATSEYAKAVAVQQFFTSPANGFVYDLTPSRARPGQDQLEAFLVGRRGFCEQYATAMAAMLRVAGVPSRVAVGFTKGSLLNSQGSTRTFSVSTRDAHAWPEAWFAGTGWVRFEPTPSQNGIAVPDYTRSVSPSPVTPVTPTPAGATPSASPKSQGSLPRDELQAQARRKAQAGSASTWVWWLLATLLLAGLAAVPALLTLLRRRRRWRRPGPLTAWQQLEEDAHDVGHPWRPGDSPRTAAQRLGAARPLPAPAEAALHRLALAAERARYARPGSSAEAGSALARDVVTVRSALRHGCPKRVRWRAQLCPPSTMRWASESVGDLLEVTTERMEDSVGRLTSRLRRVRR